MWKGRLLVAELKKSRSSAGVAGEVAGDSLAAAGGDRWSLESLPILPHGLRSPATSQEEECRLRAGSLLLASSLFYDNLT